MYLCFCQIWDAVFFGFFALFHLETLLRKNVDLRAKNPKKSPRQLSFVQLLSSMTASRLENVKKCRTRTWNLRWISLAILVLIIAQIPLLWQNLLTRKTEKAVVLFDVEQKTEYYAVPGELNLTATETVERGLGYVSATLEQTNLTQNEKVNLALRAFYQNDWQAYQNWLIAAKAMDPNERIFK